MELRFSLITTIIGGLAFNNQQGVLLIKKRKIISFNDNSYFFYSHGSKDNWKLSYCNSNGKIGQLYDKDYLKRIQSLGKIYGVDFIYKVFVKVYDLVTNNAKENNRKPSPSENDFQQILELVNLFPRTKYCSLLSIYKLFCCLYLTMIAEWYYEGTKLYHRIKHLGIYQVLFLKMDAKQAANFSKNKSYKQLDQIMKSYGIVELNV